MILLGYVFHYFHYAAVGLYHILDYYVGHNEPPLVRESFPLFVTVLFRNHLVCIFHNFHLPVVGIYHILNYYVGHDYLPLVRDSFLLLVNYFVRFLEHYGFPEQHAVIWGHFSHL